MAKRDTRSGARCYPMRDPSGDGRVRRMAVLARLREPKPPLIACIGSQGDELSTMRTRADMLRRLETAAELRVSIPIHRPHALSFPRPLAGVQPAGVGRGELDVGSFDGHLE